MRLAPLLLALAAVGLTGAKPTGELVGRVVGVTDGDTLTLLTPGKTRLKVRLDQIDAPETGQPWGALSKQALSRRVFDHTVVVRSSGTDRYGRTLGQVRAEGRDVNTAMVADGAAWAYRQYLTDSGLLTLERKARSDRRGLWALPADQRTAPWDWRAAKRDGPRVSASPAKPATIPPVSRAGLSCGVKLYCSQMTSCAEARQQLTGCGLQRLDSDGDGVPCESLCRAGA